MPPLPSGPVYEFLGFRLDCGGFELLRGGQVLRLERKPMELLILLTSRGGQLVTRNEIAERLWSSEIFVDREHGINTAIRKLRYSLRDDPNTPRFIQTVTGRGYRFIAPVERVAVPIPLAPALQSEVIDQPTLVRTARSVRRPIVWSAGLAVCAILTLSTVALYRWRHRPSVVRYTQLTDFTDSAVAPALSPDGHMLAFIRGGEPFLSSDQIYVKLLPKGEAKRITEDARPKYGLAFSPDGSEVAYTVLENAAFSTYEVSALGGEPHLLMENAAGLVWLNPQRLLFSEVRPGEGIHLGVVTATISRPERREIYFPEHERGMAHNSFPSPDRRWTLVVEMNGDGEWAPCRLVALEDQDVPRLIGPAGACTSAGWSPDGRWMYFSASVEGRSHLWRQHFPQGQAEQMTFGPTEEYGVAVDPAGRSLITSIGVQESDLWLHDGISERPLSSEGQVESSLSSPVFSPDANVVYYILRRGEGSTAELWRTMADSGKSEAVFPGVAILEFGLSPDGKRVVYTAASDGTTQLWLALVDRSSPATRLGIPGARSPQFGPHGQIFFQQAEGNRNYLEQVDPDGSHRSKVFPFPIVEFQGVSPDRRWVMAAVPKTRDRNLPAELALPLNGGAPRHICENYCLPRWSTNGKFLLVTVEAPSEGRTGRTWAIPVGPDESLPDLPAGGIEPLTELRGVAGAILMARGQLVPGADPEHYAWVNTRVHRNLYRISLP